MGSATRRSQKDSTPSVSEKSPSNSSELELLDIGQLGVLLKERRGKLSIRQAAELAGVSYSTFGRVESGAQPDLATFTRLCGWLGRHPSSFFGSVVAPEVSPLEEAITHLQADPRLSQEASSKISSLLRELYSALAGDEQTPQTIVACHLRAATVMRPGVAPRLASLLTDMEQALKKRVEQTNK